MKINVKVSVISIIIIIISGIAALIGLFSRNIHNFSAVTSSYGEKIELYQIGLYARDSVSMASQAIAQDFITLVIGIPLLIVGLYLINIKKIVHGWFLLTGTLGYFLYTYTSYAILMTFNDLYLLYVFLLILSFYGFIMSLFYLSKYNKELIFSSNYPTKSLSFFFLISGFAICIMWLGRIIPVIGKEIAPYGLEQYSTLAIQTLDLGFIVPASFVTAWLLYSKEKWGYLLSAVLVMKMITMVAAVSVMGINMKLHGVKMNVSDLRVFPIILIISIIFIIKILRTINKVELDNLK